MKLQFVLILLYFKSFLIVGQGALSVTATDSILAARYHQQFESLLYVDSQRARQYIDSLFIISKTNLVPKSTYYYHQDLGAMNFVEHHLPASKMHYQEAYLLAKQHHWHVEAIASKIWLANLAYFNNNFSSAQRLYQEVFEEASQINFVDGLATALYGLANLQDDKKIALKYLIKVDSVYQRHDTISPVLANTYDFIGRIYLETFHNKALAKEYLLKALEVSKKTNYRSGIDFFKNELMHLDFHSGDYENVREYLNGLLEQSMQQKDSIAIARDLLQLGVLESEFNQFKLAEQHLQTALSYFVILDDTQAVDKTNLLLAQLEIKKRNPLQAQQYLDRVRTVEILPRNSDFIEKFYNVQIEILALNKDFEKALSKQQELDSIKSSFVDFKNNEAFLAMERRFQTKKKEQEIALLTSQNALTQQQKSNQRNLFLSILLVVLLASFSFYALYRNRQKVNKKLEELNTFKSKFYVNISHEFRTPLTLLLGPIEKQLEAPEISPQQRSELNLMRRNAQRLLNLTNQLLDLSKLESGHLKLHVSHGNLRELLYALSAAFEYQALQKHINFVVDLKVDDQAWFDKDLMEKVIVNLLSNAFKYTPEHREIVFKAECLNDNLKISITNEGHPLTKQQIDKLFDRFYQVDEHSEGVGIGLSYVKELVNLSHGSISVEQLTNKNLTFNLSLPFKKHQFEIEELKEYSPETNNSIIIPSGVDQLVDLDPDRGDDSPIILLVEDNQDIRDFITSSFKDEYHVVEATNGKEGLQKAIELIPDIIISDVMMPVMDGFELTSILKQDERTCHIPIVLLTAKVEEADEFIGLTKGADDYIIKPFKIKLLKSRVKNLLDIRNKLRQRYSQELILKPKDIVITNLDERFLEKVQNILDENLTEASFTAEDFSKALGMSRMQLHRKLKALTGSTTSEFVREQRLHLATTLIGKGNINISEIGYMVGFNDHSYFAKCFKKAYGCSPSEYLPSDT